MVRLPYILLVAVVCTLLACTVAAAPAPIENTGHELIKFCNAQSEKASDEKWVMCVGIVSGLELGFVTGATDAIAAMDSSLTPAEANQRFQAMANACIPRDITKLQIAHVVVTFLASHTNLLGERSVDLVIAADQWAWPCHK